MFFLCLQGSPACQIDDFLCILAFFVGPIGLIGLLSLGFPGLPGNRTPREYQKRKSEKTVLSYYPGGRYAGFKSGPAISVEAREKVANMDWQPDLKYGEEWVSSEAVVQDNKIIEVVDYYRDWNARGKHVSDDPIMNDFATWFNGPPYKSRRR